MQSQLANNQRIEEQGHLNANSIVVETDLVTQLPYTGSEPTYFHSHFHDCMEMLAEASQVTAYLDAHQDWFCRCASPMKVEGIGDNAYALVIGRFGAFGYEVEPKIGLEMLPSDHGLYRIQSVPIPDYTAPGYDVDFHATQSFVEVPVSEYFQPGECEAASFPKAITRVEWDLDLKVALRFPKFINKLPKSLVQTTGDRLLCQVVRQVSKALTHKVQDDFHTSLGMSTPKQFKKR